MAGGTVARRIVTSETGKPSLSIFGRAQAGASFFVLALTAWRLSGQAVAEDLSSLVYALWASTMAETPPGNLKRKQERFPCPGCGADLVYDPQNNCLSCPYCGRQEPLPASSSSVEE